tara:strand:- start:5851 stop:6897 length:1047 start_codon:yes stop_codon:yes gene_type:complete
MRAYFIAIFLGVLVMPVLFGSSPAKSQKRVFVLHSYERNHVCGQPQNEGLVRALAEAGFEKQDITYEVYAMDTKRKNNTSELISEQASIALNKIKHFKPDVLVTLDDNAFKSVALTQVDTKLPIVFSGMNNQPENYNKSRQWLESRKKPGHNITGIYEKLHFATALRAQMKILTSLKKIRIYSDNSPTGKAIVNQIKLELKNDPVPVEYDFVITDSWETYKKSILADNQSDIDTLYPVALRLKDKSGKTLTANEILQWTSTHSKKPSIPLNFAFVRLGLFGGAGVDFNHMGYQAGKMVAKILNGVDVGMIPIEDAARYALVFHLDRAKMLGIKIPNEILLAADDVYRY